MDMPGLAGPGMAAGRALGREGAPGQVAKMAVKMAAEAGAVLPPNAQGYAASAIAKGADPASVFAAMIPPAVQRVKNAVPENQIAAPTSKPKSTAIAIR